MDGSTIFSFRYSDEAPWPAAADDSGHSLVLMSPGTHPNPSLAENWRPSASTGGTPGTDDAIGFNGDPSADADADGQPAIVEYALGTSDAVAASFTQPAAGFESIDSGDGNVATFLIVEFSRALAADAALASAQFSDDLIQWEPATLVRRELDVDGRLREVWRSASPAAGARQFIRVRVALRT
jgi:hypothetical protein